MIAICDDAEYPSGTTNVLSDEGGHVYILNDRQRFIQHTFGQRRYHMADIDLLRSQRNQILDLIKNLELDPFNFKWGEYPSQFNRDATVAQLTYNGTEFHYVFDMQRGEHYAFFSPGRDKLFDQEYPGSWELQFGKVYDWLTYVKREIEEPDLWHDLGQYRLPPGTSLDPETENRAFSVAEVKQLKAGIGNLRKYLECEFDGVEDDLKIIHEKLDYLCEAAERQGRKDWFHTCIGVLFTLGSAIGLNQAQGQKLWALLKDTVLGVVRLLTP